MHMYICFHWSTLWPTLHLTRKWLKIGTLFDKWCTASKASDFASLRELMLLEEFKRCLLDSIERKWPPCLKLQCRWWIHTHPLTHKATFPVIADKTKCAQPVQRQVRKNVWFNRYQKMFLLPWNRACGCRLYGFKGSRFQVPLLSFHC